MSKESRLKGLPIHKMAAQKHKKHTGLLKVYDNSFPNHKKAWRHLVHAAEYVGWKDIHYMILRLQEELKIDGYKLRKN